METNTNYENTYPPMKHTLDSEIVNNIMEKIRNIQEKCEGNTSEETLNDRKDQLAYAKIITNIYNKDIKFLIEAHTELGICYLENDYFEQANEHLIDALKLNENLSSENNLTMKEYQIKISVNLARSYLKNGKYDEAGKLCEKILYINKILFGEDHPSNADIYYILSKVNLNNEKYNEAIDNLRSMYEILFEIAIKLSEIFKKTNNVIDSYNIIVETDDKYTNKCNRSLKDRVILQKLRIDLCSNLKDMDLYLNENLKLEEMLEKEDKSKKTLAKINVNIAYIYLENGDKNKCLEYLKKAQKIFSLYGDAKNYDEITKRINELENDEEKKDTSSIIH